MPCSGEAEAAVRDAARELSRAGEMLRANPSEIVRISEHLQVATERLARVKGNPGGDAVSSLRSEFLRVRTLFESAAGFYRGWGSLAAVSERDVGVPSISLEG